MSHAIVRNGCHRFRLNDAEWLVACVNFLRNTEGQLQYIGLARTTNPARTCDGRSLSAKNAQEDRRGLF